MDSLFTAFFREAHAVSFDTVEKEEIRDLIIERLGFISPRLAVVTATVPVTARR